MQCGHGFIGQQLISVELKYEICILCKTPPRAALASREINCCVSSFEYYCCVTQFMAFICKAYYLVTRANQTINCCVSSFEYFCYVTQCMAFICNAYYLVTRANQSCYNDQNREQFQLTNVEPGQTPWQPSASK